MKEYRISEDCIIYNDMPKGWIQGEGQPKWHKSIYNRWHNMWRRCKDPNNPKYKNYKDCEIDEHYRYLSHYVNDIMQLENFDKLCENSSKWHIDKDKKDPNNRCYFYEHLCIISDIDNHQEMLCRTSSLRPLIAIKGHSVLLFKSFSSAKSKGFNTGNIYRCLDKQNFSYITHKGYKWYRVSYKHNKTLRFKFHQG